MAGIIGYKGRVHVNVGQPLTDGFTTPEELAAAIDRSIHAQYRLFASNLLAADVDASDVTPEQRTQFEQRMAAMDPKWREIAKAMYAKPVENQRS